MYNSRSVDLMLSQSGQEHQKVDIDEQTEEYMIGFLKDYYELIRNGMIDDTITIEKRIEKWKSLNEKYRLENCLLGVHLKRLIDNYNIENENALFNDIFKIISYFDAYKIWE